VFELSLDDFATGDGQTEWPLFSNWMIYSIGMQAYIIGSIFDWLFYYWQVMWQNNLYKFYWFYQT